MSTDPLISVVIPCYNDGAYLPETIGHLKKQTFTDFEVIIVNDGSTDKATLDILDNLTCEGYMVLHKANGRMSSARNHGVLHARGKYIAALDADDYFDPGFFEKAVRILNEQENVATVTSYIQLFGAIKKVSKPRGGNEYNFLFFQSVSRMCHGPQVGMGCCWRIR